VTQCVTNVAIVVFFSRIYGKHAFYHRLFGIVHAGKMSNL
jgi:hypothetical protein